VLLLPLLLLSLLLLLLSPGCKKGWWPASGCDTSARLCMRPGFEGYVCWNNGKWGTCQNGGCVVSMAYGLMFLGFNCLPAAGRREHERVVVQTGLHVYLKF
jgi:hypothetical protein